MIHEDWIARHAALLRQATPEEIAQWPQAKPPPDRWPGWRRVCLAAFWDLSTCRTYSLGGMGGAIVGPIPWTAINAWGRERGLRGAVLVAFEAVIRAIDNAWLPVETARLNPPAKGKR